MLTSNQENPPNSVIWKQITESTPKTGEYRHIKHYNSQWIRKYEPVSNKREVLTEAPLATRFNIVLRHNFLTGSYRNRGKSYMVNQLLYLGKNRQLSNVK